MRALTLSVALLISESYGSTILQKQMRGITDDDFAFLSHQDTSKPAVVQLEDTQNIQTDVELGESQVKKPQFQPHHPFDTKVQKQRIEDKKQDYLKSLEKIKNQSKKEASQAKDKQVEKQQSNENKDNSIQDKMPKKLSEKCDDTDKEPEAKGAKKRVEEKPKQTKKAEKAEKSDKADQNSDPNSKNINITIEIKKPKDDDQTSEESTPEKSEQASDSKPEGVKENPKIPAPQKIKLKKIDFEKQEENSKKDEQQSKHKENILEELTGLFQDPAAYTSPGDEVLEQMGKLLAAGMKRIKELQKNDKEEVPKEEPQGQDEQPKNDSEEKETKESRQQELKEAKRKLKELEEIELKIPKEDPKEDKELPSMDGLDKSDSNDEESLSDPILTKPLPKASKKLKSKSSLPKKHNKGALQQKQKKEEEELINQLVIEEQKRIDEMKKASEISTKMDEEVKMKDIEVEKEQKQLEEIQKLTEAERNQLAEAEQAQQEWELAQANQRTKELKAKKQAVQANLLKIKKKNALQAHKAREKIKLLKETQSIEAQESMSESVTKSALAQDSAKKQKELDELQAKLETEQREKKQIQEKLEKDKEEMEAKLLAQQQAQQQEVEEQKVKELVIENQQKKKEQAAQNKQLLASYEASVRKMNAQLTKFSRSLSRDSFEEALKIRKQLQQNEKFQAAGFEMPELKLASVDIFQKQFTFPQIAKNDFAQDELSALQTEQDALIADPEGETALGSFITQATNIASKLKERYTSQWANPLSEQPELSSSKSKSKINGKKTLSVVKTKIHKIKKQQAPAPVVDQTDEVVDSNDVTPSTVEEQASLAEAQSKDDEAASAASAETDSTAFSDVYELAAMQAEPLKDYEEIVV